jgi:hypothetical protein
VEGTLLHAQKYNGNPIALQLPMFASWRLQKRNLPYGATRLAEVAPRWPRWRRGSRSVFRSSSRQVRG